MGEHCGYIGEKTFLLNPLALAPREWLQGHYSIDKLIHLEILSQVSECDYHSLLTLNLMMLQYCAPYVPLNLHLVSLQPELD